MSALDLKKVPGFNCWADKIGNIWLLKKGSCFRKANARLNEYGYLKVSVKDEDTGKHVNRGVARLLWLAHKGEIPEGFVVDHKDEVKTNNVLTNLQLLTNQENIAKSRKFAKHHVFRRGIEVTYPNGTKERFKTQSAVARHLGVSLKPVHYAAKLGLRTGGGCTLRFLSEDETVALGA